MKPPFADTYYFIGLLNPADGGHRKVAAWSRLVDRLVTTEWVLLERAEAFCDTPHRKLFSDTRAALLADGATELVSFDMSLHLRAIELYDRRPDNAWSLTNCVSFMAMQDRGLTEALTADRHFEQAGFVALLK